MCRLTIIRSNLKGRTMKNITFLICLFLSFSIIAAEKIESKSEKIQRYKVHIKKIDKIISNKEIHRDSSGVNISIERWIKYRKANMDELVKLEGKEKRVEIEESCINKYNGWTQTWTKENNPKKTCQKKWIADEEECAIKSGKALTDKAAGLIFNKCNEKAQSTYKTCRNNLDEKYKHILPKAEKCVDQAYLEN